MDDLLGLLVCFADHVFAHALGVESHGVEVVLDKWDLKEGQDKYVFMEQCVNNPDRRDRRRLVPYG